MINNHNLIPWRAMLRSQTVIRNLMYRLKRRYGSPGDYYHQISVTDDLATGKSSVTKIKYPINKMLLLPAKVAREMRLTGEYGRIDSNMPAPEFDTDSAIILIDKRDLPIGFQYNVDDYIIAHTIVQRKRVARRRYNISKIEEFEDGGAYVINGRFIHTGMFFEIFDLNIKESVIINQTATNMEPSGLPMPLPGNIPYVPLNNE